MTVQEKKHLIQLISEGHIREAIDALSAIKRNKSIDREILAIASRYNRLKKKERSGILSFEQVTRAENQIVEHLMDVIHHPEDEAYPIEKSIYTTDTTRPVLWKYIITATIIVVMLLGLAEVFHITNIVPAGRPLQLTVFVKDVQGNVALELKGELNITLGNRSLHKVIGENGRVNFADITPDTKGNTIKIGLKAPGWQIDGNHTFVFTGDPIDLTVKRDHSLGIIKGMVKSRDGQKFIERAQVLINTDTVVWTDENGIFKVILPEKMRIKTKTELYHITISKQGYKTIDSYYSPKSSDAEFRLEKESNQ
ncbi:MAG: hypothetical protein AAF934_12910 [Bacteroidota bacterium]